MDTPLEIAFVNMESSEALEQLVRERADKLHRFYDRITSVRVAVEVPHKSPAGASKAFHVRVETRVPGTELVVSQDPGDQRGHFDAYRAVRDAFDAMERRLEGHSKKLQGRDKAAMAAGEGPPQGRVLRVFPEYGFIEAVDGREIYFHRNAVVGGTIEDLKKGQPVEMALIEEPDNAMGPQATTVKAIGPLELRGEPPSNR